MTRDTAHPYLMALLNPSGGEPPVTEEGESEWAQAVEGAEAQDLSPIVFRWLVERSEHRPVLRRLAAGLRPRMAQRAARSMFLAEELALILKSLDQRGIACIPIRGPALATQLYGDPTARFFGDLDLLVQRTQLSEVGTALAELDYREVDRRPGFAKTYSYTLEFVKERPARVCVEPHWTIAYPPFADCMDMDAVWARAVPGRVVGVDTLLLSRSDLLLHLCFHLIHKGAQAPLLWWYELDLVIRQEPDTLDWTQVLHMARQTGQHELLAGLLGEVRALLGSPIPAPIFTQLRAPSEPVPRNFLYRRLTPLLRGDSDVDGRESLAHLLTMRGFQAKWRYACGILFPSSDFMRAHYGLSGRPWLGFRYMARLLYFLWEGGKGLVGLVAIRPTPRQSPPYQASLEPPRSITSRRRGSLPQAVASKPQGPATP